MKASLSIIASGLLLALAACANPVVAPPVSAADSDKSCAAIEEDIAQTALLKRQAREHDRFEWRYVFMVNAAVSWHRMNQAEKAATERLEQLNKLAVSKNCMGDDGRVVLPDTPATPQPVE